MSTVPATTQHTRPHMLSLTIETAKENRHTVNVRLRELYTRAKPPPQVEYELHGLTHQREGIGRWMERLDLGRAQRLWQRATCLLVGLRRRASLHLPPQMRGELRRRAHQVVEQLVRRQPRLLHAASAQHDAVGLWAREQFRESTRTWPYDEGGPQGEGGGEGWVKARGGRVRG